MELTPRELHLCREWFDHAQDINPRWLGTADYELAKTIYEQLDMHIPSSILLNCKVKKDEEGVG